MKTSPLLTRSHISFAPINTKIQLTKSFRHRLDSLIVHARRRIQCFGKLHITLLQCQNKTLGLPQQFIQLRQDPCAVLIHRQLQ